MWTRTLLSLTCLSTALLLPARTALARIEIVGADEIRERIEIRDGVATLDVDGHRWELVTDPRAPFLSTLGDGAFHPMDRREVEAALASLRGAGRLSNAHIYILPYPRREVLKSSCQGTSVYLSPGIRKVSREHVHMTVVHELGHAYQHVHVAEGSPAWTTYLQLRALDDPRFQATADHRDRPAEIFAEDFRVLMGGALAASAAVENSDIPEPGQVAGLSLWFRHGGRSVQEAVASLTGPVSFPNPYRAVSQTSLTVRFSGSAGVVHGRADIYDIHGRNVRSLDTPRGDGNDTLFRWDGRDRSGQAVATGTYFVRWQGRPEFGTARVQVLH